MKKNEGSRTSSFSRITAAGLAAFLAPAPVSAEEITGSLTLYGWIPWMEIKATTESGATSKTSIGADDVLDALEIAFMAAGEIHYGRFGFLQDTVYSVLESGGTLGGPFSSSVDVETKMLLATNALSYQVYVKDGRLIEPYVGARYVNIETDVSITGGGPIGASASAEVDADWWDPVIGVRGRMPLTEKLSISGFADIGGFGAGSEFTWEIYGGLNYALSERFSAIAGFRYLSIDYDADGADIELDTYGPVIGMNVRF